MLSLRQRWDRGLSSPYHSATGAATLVVEMFECLDVWKFHSGYRTYSGISILKQKIRRKDAIK
jgi:hypothetical protein